MRTALQKDGVGGNMVDIVRIDQIGLVYLDKSTEAGLLLYF